MFTFSINQSSIKNFSFRLQRVNLERVVVVLAAILSVTATVYAYAHGYIISYGDAESHLNIAKRVADSLTPGFAQLGGIWLPLPHLLLVPFVKIDFLWRSGLAGSIVSGAAFVVSCLYLYKLAFLITARRAAAFVAALVFMANPNVLYLQTTPMTEIVLIVFFVLSSYYFIQFIRDDSNVLALIMSAFFGFCAVLSRYDGWFLVGVQALVLALLYFPWRSIPKSLEQLRKNFDRSRWQRLEGRVILFSTLAFLGIVLWLAWDWLILGDPLYFTHSQFSAKSQQQEWLARGELPAYGNIFLSVLYYFVTSMSNVGLLMFASAIAGFSYLVLDKGSKHRFFVALILLVPFIFNVLTLFMGQSVIFIPHITPSTFEWTLFNVRYGVMMAPFAAVCTAYLFYKIRGLGRIIIVSLFVMQLGLYGVGYSKVISLEDGRSGLSSATANLHDAQRWLATNYDEGLVLVDDYARTLSIIRTSIPMQDIIYIGNRPYWQESLAEPEKYATWIIMQQNDEVWSNIHERPEIQGRLFKYFEKVYTSPEILIFKRNPAVPVEQG